MSNNKLVTKTTLDDLSKRLKENIIDNVSVNLEKKADINHNHNSTYYTKTEVDDNLDTINTELNSIKQKIPATIYVDDNDNVWIDW